MAKKTSKTEPKKIAPRFTENTVVATPSLVADAHGVAWWVDPFTKKIERVET